MGKLGEKQVGAGGGDDNWIREAHCGQAPLRHPNGDRQGGSWIHTLGHEVRASGRNSMRWCGTE